MKALLAAVILAHSWYPYECCSDRDCHPVKSVKEVPNGYQAEGIFFPKSLAKPSQDGDFHVCYNPATKKPLCIFIPMAV